VDARFPRFQVYGALVTATAVLWTFIALRLAQHLAERGLARLNRVYYLDPARQAHARSVLRISEEDMAKTLAYSEDKYRFAALSGWISLVVTLAFLAAGGLGWLEALAAAGAAGVGGGVLVTGLFFFALLGLAGLLLGLPFDYYRTFVIEARHGFNRQTPRGFWLDRVKGLVLGVVLGGLVLSVILWIMGAAGESWWIYAWAALSAFSILTAWLYPTFLAPLFNKFSPVPEGELKEGIESLAQRVGFRTAGVFVMDASKRSSHGNAYFTGVMGKKRIVLFDTLVDSMGASEVIAVLAHELGHFKLKHVFWALVRGVATVGVTFYLLSLCLPLEVFYRAFGLAGVSNYGALIVFTMWFGILDFVLQPFGNWLSRRNEFAADAFALRYVPDRGELGSALLKLREKSHAMPLSHPVFSSVYHSHPPLLERLEAMRS
jgi:STE24 endopeptidase